jgi:hypothetical protein
VVQDGELRIVMIVIGVYGANVCKVFLNGFNFTEATLVKVFCSRGLHMPYNPDVFSAPSKASSASAQRSRRVSWPSSTSTRGRRWAV